MKYWGYESGSVAEEAINHTSKKEKQISLESHKELKKGAVKLYLTLLHPNPSSILNTTNNSSKRYGPAT